MAENYDESLEDDRYSMDLDSTPAPKFTGQGAGSEKHISPQLARVLKAKQERFGTDSQTLGDAMNLAGRTSPIGGQRPPAWVSGASGTKTGFVESAVEGIESLTQEQRIAQLQLMVQQQQQQIDHFHNSPGKGLQIDDDIEFSSSNQGATLALMREQMASSNSMIAMLAKAMADGNALQKESVTLSKQQYASSKATKTVEKKFLDMEEGFPTLGINSEGQGMRDQRKWNNRLRKEFGDLMKHKELKAKLTKKAINEITGEPPSVPKDQRINFVGRWTSANNSSAVKNAYALVKPHADAYSEWLGHYRMDASHADHHPKPTIPDYTQAFEVFLTKLAAHKPQQMAKEHKICYPALYDAKLRWKKGDTFEACWERILQRRDDAEEILRELYREACIEDGTEFDPDEESWFTGTFCELEGADGVIKNVVSGLPSDVIDYITITADAWPKSEDEWTYAHFAKIIDAYLLSDSYKAKKGGQTKAVQALQQQVASLQQGGGGGGANGKRGGKQPRSQQKAVWSWMNPSEFNHFKSTPYHIIDGSAVSGKDGSCHPENGCDTCGCHGHVKKNCADANPSGAKTLVPSDIDSRRRTFGPNFATIPNGAGTSSTSTVQHVSQGSAQLEAKMAAMQVQNEKLIAAVKGCSEVCDVKFIDMICATTGKARQALYIQLDNDIWVMIDSGAEVYAMVGTKAHRQLNQLAWLGDLGPRNPKVKFASISGDGLGYVGDTGGYGYYKGRAIPIDNASVCRNIPDDTVLLGNLFLKESGSMIDWRDRKVTLRFGDDSPDLVVPFADESPSKASTTWCHGLRQMSVNPAIATSNGYDGLENDECEGHESPKYLSANVVSTINELDRQDQLGANVVSTVNELERQDQLGEMVGDAGVREQTDATEGPRINSGCKQTTADGRSQYRRLPMGLSDSPGILANGYETFEQYWDWYHQGKIKLEEHIEMEWKMEHPEVSASYRGEIFRLYANKMGIEVFQYGWVHPSANRIGNEVFDVEIDYQKSMKRKVSEHKALLNRKVNDDVACTKEAVEKEDVEQQPDVVDQKPRSVNMVKQWSSAFMTMVTMAVMATTTATATIMENALPLGLVAGVVTTGLHEPVVNGLWDAKTLLQEDMMPNFNYEDIFFGPTKSRHYSYEIGHVSDGATNVIETQYRYNPHDAAAESRLSPIAQYVFTIPTKPEGDDVGAEQHITNVRKWRTENKHVTHEYETKPNDGGSTERPSNKINNATNESTSPQAQCPLQARMQDRDLEYTDEEAEEYVVRAVRGAGVDQSQTLWDQLECDNSDWCKKNRVQVRAMLHKHKTVFECDGKQPPFVDKEGKVVEIPIHLTDEEPVAQRAWRLSPEKLAVLDQYLDELLDQGVIEPTKYSPYSAVTVLVPKKGQFDKAGLQRLRVTTDYRRLNRKTRKLAYNGKTVQEMFDMVDGATIFSTYDVSSAFYNLKLRADAREKTAFSTPHRGLFQYLRLPMGLSVSPGILACEYEEMFRVPVTINGKYHPQALGAIVGIYCDDVIAFSNEEDHLEVNKFVLATLKKHNVNLRADKSFIGRAEVEYLGMVISGDGISISPSKTKAVWEAKKPTNAEETRRFLGMASYLRSFVPDFGANSKHLTANLAKGVTWQWDDRHEREYRYLLNAICSDNCLAPFSWGKESILRTDSSAAGYGAVLCQMHGRLRRPVAFISRQLNGTEASRPGRDLEAGCLTWACQKFRNYLIHRPFIVHGDCSNLQWVHKYEGNNRRLYNYSLILSQYQMRFVYKKGSTMGDCDWLSRSAVKQARDETDADNPDHNMPEVGSDLGATPYSDSRIASTKAIDPNDISSTLRQWDEEHATEEASVATLRQKARQPRQGARNTYHCCKKGTVGRGRCPNICPQFWLAPDNKLYCTACLPSQWEQRARSISVSDWDRHSLLSEEYRQREHWHRLGWNKSEHNNDFDCDSGCPCCKAEAGEFFSSCPVCNEDLYGDARPLWDIDEALKGRAENALRRTGHYKPNRTRGTARSPARSHQGGEAAPKTQNVSIVKRQKVKPAWVKRVPKPHQPPLVFTDKKARTDDPVPAYSVLSVGGGIGTDAMATADFDHMKVTVACESDEKTAKLAQNRTGTPMYRCTRELVDHLRSGKIEQPDVLSYTGELSRDRDDLLRVIDAASPTVIMAESTDQITGISTSDAVDAARIKDTQHSNIKLEATLHKQGYVVESATLNASEHGGHTANTRYILVAHKTKAYYKWPEQRTQFPGCTEILQHAHTVDPRTRRRGYQPVEGQPQGNFSPWKAGFIKGGGEYRGVYDPTNPLPAIRPHYNKHTREHGGQYVVDSEGTRLLTQTEEMRLLHFTEEAISQLQDETPWVQQHCVGTASCVALKTALFASIQDLLDAAQTTPGLAMPREHKAYGILAHAVMPSLHEISVAQGKDPEVRQLLTYVAADEKQRRDMVLPKQYERHAKFMHLNDGILFYRDILNDEWLTDAVVLPPSLIEKAMVAFHDSGYGGHQGFHKTKVAMQERVWFPKMSKTITDHIDNCDACKRAKAIRRKHAGKSQSSLYREAFEVVAIDLMGPYLKSSDGNMYIMHVIDLFTNWNIAVAIPNKEAKTIASAFHEHVILKEAETPAAIISDRGTEFLNTLFAELTAQFNLAHYKTTPLHPTGNAANERQHRTYGAILKTMLHKYGKEFDEALPYATYAINTHAIEGTNVSPFEMRYGRKPKCPNSVAATDNPAWTALKATMSSAEHIKMLRERMADAQINVQMARLQVTRKNQAQMARHHYEKHFNVGDLLLRWTGNTKRGLYGKLGYTTVGPFEVVSIHKRNRDIYELRHLASPDKGTSMHHVRELCPYITKEAHEKQHANEAVNQPISKLDPKVGDYLLLPNGSRDFLCKVLSVQHGRVLFQYLNKENPGKGSIKPYSALKLTWMRKKPSNNPFDELASDDWEEKYCHQLTPAQVASGWKAYDETLSVDEFYQRIVHEKDLLKTPNGITLTPSKRAVITKLRPVHMQ